MVMQDLIRTMIKGVIHEVYGISRFMKKSRFKDLPLEYKISVIIYCQEGVGLIWDGIDDSHPVTNWWTDERVPMMIKNYEKRKGHQSFRYGRIPMNVLIASVDKMVKDNPDTFPFNGFQDYHDDYQASHGVDHGPSVLPVILYPPSGGIVANEPIEDGWHRFHSYVKKGLKEIPAMQFI